MPRASTISEPAPRPSCCRFPLHELRQQKWLVEGSNGRGQLLGAVFRGHVTPWPLCSQHHSAGSQNLNVEAAATPGHPRGISEAIKLNQGLPGDPVAVDLEGGSLSVNPRGRKGAGSRTVCQQRGTNQVLRKMKAGEKRHPCGV